MLTLFFAYSSDQIGTFRHEVTKLCRLKPQLGKQFAGALLSGSRDQGHHSASSANPAGAACSVHIGFGVVGRVCLQHEVDVIDVNAAGGDIGRDQHFGSTLRKLRKIALSSGLTEITMQ